MKTVHQIFRKSFLAATAILGGFILSNCSNDDAATPVNNEEQDAVDAITYSVSSESNGLARTMESASAYADEQAVYTENPALECGMPYNSNFTDSFSGTNYSYNYSAARQAELNCTTEGEPATLLYSATYSGTYDTPRMASDDSADASLTISGLETTSASVTFTGSYERNGTQVSKIRNQNTFESTLTYSLDSVVFGKTSHNIESGSAAVTFIGTSSTGNTYNYSGNITFNGDGTATLEINGNTYTITL
ncbi:hypothetical protein [Flavobacterium silvaticum]|uniref:Lipoprotein n=1 Tax=Flavobacterium silvaticum TaxID=1852020 RepID=A0A972FUF7_9FLAO|nr:hypothetical protein [Flavobacterium silvaticum]NMH27800.1 hypothetical protein [Flavobacterium silvaticum]